MDTRRPGRFVAGDPLRGIAALLVVIYHAAFFTLPITVGERGLLRSDNYIRDGYGNLGYVVQVAEMTVYVFLVLSGYLISKPFVTWLVAEGRRPRLGAYVRNRALRIVPVFWFVIAVALVTHGLNGSSVLDLALLMGFLQNWDQSAIAHWVQQGWTLGVEIAFYAALPVAALLLALPIRRLRGQGRRAIVLLGFVAFAAAVSLAFRRDAHTLQAQRSILTLGFAFTPGIALAIADVTISHRFAGWRHAGIACAAMVPAAYLAWALRLAIGPAEKQAVSGFLAATGAGLLVAAPMVLQWSQGRCWRWLDNRVCHWLGERSYSLYVVHFLLITAVIDLARHADGPWRGFLLVAVVGVPLSLLAAEVSFRLVERPFMNLRPDRRRSGAAAPAPAGQVAREGAPAG